MYRVFIERAAEKDLKRLSSGVHDRVIIAIRGLASNPRPPRLALSRDLHAVRFAGILSHE